MTPLHRPLAQAIVDALQQIFKQNRYAENVVGHLLSNNPRWGGRDRRFVAEAIYEIVRHPIDPSIYTDLLNKQFNIAKLGNNTPLLWHLLGNWHLLKGNELPNWDELKDIDPDNIKKQYANAQQQRLTKHILPNWLDKLASEALGESTWERELNSLDQAANVFIRVNTLVANTEKVINALAKSDIIVQAIPNMPHTLRIEGRKNLSATEAYRKGWFEIQDAGSQTIAPFCDIQPDMFVLDACAGAGGKALHLAALMNNKGTIVAMDTDKKKLAILEQRAIKAGITIIRTRHINNAKVIDKYKYAADRLLLDVPCSGLGTMRRQPDLKWQLSPQKISDLLNQQADILSRYSTMLHPNGKLTYATCSILPAENELQIRHFLEKNNQNPDRKATFALSKQQHISPAQTGFDGFYMAQLTMNNDLQAF